MTRLLFDTTFLIDAERSADDLDDLIDDDDDIAIAAVTVADVSPEMLSVARDRARSRGLSLDTVEVDLTADALTVPGAPFDAVTVMWGLRYVDDPARVLAG